MRRLPRWLAALPALLIAAAAVAEAPPKVLKYAFQIAETGFDPAQISDTYSRTITPHIFVERAIINAAAVVWILDWWERRRSKQVGRERSQVPPAPQSEFAKPTLL